MTTRKHGIHHKELEGAITSEDVLGKDVIDSEGRFIGVTNTVYLDPKSLRVLGVAVDKGFLKKGLVIGADHVKEVTSHAVFLSTRPAHEIRGMRVFDVDGADVGVVEDVLLNDEQNAVTGLHVKRTRFGPTITIPETAVARIDENVFLRLPIEEIV